MNLTVQSYNSVLQSYNLTPYNLTILQFSLTTLINLTGKKVSLGYRMDRYWVHFFSVFFERSFYYCQKRKLC